VNFAHEGGFIDEDSVAISEVYWAIYEAMTVVCRK